MLKALLLSSCALMIHAQSVSGPIPAFIFDSPTGSIRAVTGSLGASSLGPALVDRVDFASVAPSENYGIAVRQGQIVSMSGLGTGQVSVNPIAAAGLVPEGAAWSDDGTVTVLYSRTANWLQIYRGFPGSIVAGEQVTPPGSLSSVAVDAHGQNIAVGIAGDVFQVGADLSFRSLANVSAPISLAFAADGTLYALDQSTNQIFEINPSTLAFQSWPTQVDDAVAIRAGVDAASDNVLYIAGRGSRTLVSVDRVTHFAIGSAALSFGPSIIEPLGSQAFALTRRLASSDILWSFVNSAEPAVFFVPAPPTVSHRQEISRQ